MTRTQETKGPPGRSDAERIKALLDPIQFISKYVDLKRQGSRYTGCCPFHEDKTPSFSVNADGRYKCFGCTASGGDVLDFIQEYEKVDFVEALRQAASEAGVHLEPINRPPEHEKDLWAALQSVGEFYQGSIRYHRADAEAFFKKRGISKESITRHRLGFAAKKALNLEPLCKRFGHEVLAELGVIRKSDTGEWYSFFRGRAIFPVLNRSGNIISLVGRALENTSKVKYLTLNTPFFKRSEMVYGMHTVTEPNGTVYLAEGPIDAVLVNQQLRGQVIAPLGTEVTEKQIGTVVPRCDALDVLVDGDCAGRKAAVQLARSLPGHLDHPVDVGFWTFPEGEDPGSWLIGRESLDELERKPIDQVLIAAARHLFAMDTYIGQARAAAWLAENMPPTPAGPAVEVLRYRLANALALPIEALEKKKTDG